MLDLRAAFDILTGRQSQCVITPLAIGKSNFVMEEHVYDACRSSSASNTSKAMPAILPSTAGMIKPDPVGCDILKLGLYAQWPERWG